MKGEVANSTFNSKTTSMLGCNRVPSRKRLKSHSSSTAGLKKQKALKKYGKSPYTEGLDLEARRPNEPATHMTSKTSKKKLKLV